MPAANASVREIGIIRSSPFSALFCSLSIHLLMASSMLAFHTCVHVCASLARVGPG